MNKKNMGGNRKVLIWLSCVALVMMNNDVAEGLGINWGRGVYNQMIPSAVVDMLVNNEFDYVKLFNADPYVVRAFANTTIELMIAIPNEELDRFSNSYANAQQFVKANVTGNLDIGVKIKYVAVGNEPFSKYNNGTFDKITFPALNNINKAIVEAKLGDQVKATIPLSYDICDSTTKLPSRGMFRDYLKETMLQIVQLLHDNDAPFIINISPFRAMIKDTWMPFNYFFKEDNASMFKDGNLIYNNYFDVSYDTVAWALSNIGFKDMKIIVGEIGWPTDGHFNATMNLANQFYTWMAPKISVGTPLRPGPMDIYLYNLLDEGKRSIAGGKSFERHWGVFDYDGRPRFNIDFKNHGAIKVLAAVNGLTYLPTRWCVLNKEIRKRTQLLDEVFKAACEIADCSALDYGSACNVALDYYGNVSYAFNMVYQTYSQVRPDVCTSDTDVLKGMGETVINDPSIGFCMFKIQLVGGSNRLSTPSIFTPLILALALLSIIFT